MATGIYLKPDAAVAIRATGRVSMGAGWAPLPPSGKTRPYASLTPGDNPRLAENRCGGGFPAPSAPCWTLIGRVGEEGEPFYVGDGIDIHTAAGGQLFLGVNDNQLGDNSGAWTATVTVNSGLAAAAVVQSSGPNLPPEPRPPATTGPAPPSAVIPSSQEPAAPLRAFIRIGQTSIELPTGNYYIYGMVTGGGAPSNPFTVNPDARVVNASGVVSAAVSSGTNFQNNFTTSTGYHVIGGASVIGSWFDVEPYYGSNSRPGASNATATFLVPVNSLVVVIGLASSQQQVEISGVPGLRIDASSSGLGATEGMVIAHTFLPPGRYNAIEHSTALAAGQDPRNMADLIGVFVFEEQQ